MPYDDTGDLKAAYYGSMGSQSQPSDSSGSSSGSGFGNFLQVAGAGLAAVNPILGAATSILGGILGSNAQNRANEANIAMQRETNELQYRMFNESNAFTKEMWNLQNEYNTPEQQAARLKAAGINPAFVFGNGSVSEAGGISSQAPPSLTAPHVDPYNIQPATATAVDAFLQSQMQTAQIRNMHENERHLAIQNELDNMRMLDQVESLRIDNKQKQQLYKFLFETFDAQKAAVNKNNALLDAQSENMYSQAAAATLHSQVENALARSQLRLNNKEYERLDAAISEIGAQIQYLGALSATERQRRVSYILDNGLSAIDFENHYALRDQLKNELQAEINQTIQEWNDYEVNWWNRTIQGYIPFVSPAVGPTTNRAVSHRPTRVRGFAP